MMSSLRIHLLGAFKVFRDGQLLTAGEWRSQQTRTILKLLLAQRGHVVPTDQLLEVLWPGEGPDTARRRLHVRISQLRRALDPDDPSACILTVAGGYTFNPEADCWLDVADFESHARQGRRCQEKGDLAAAVTAYEAARALYGGHLFEEDLYEDWAFAGRERLRERFLTVLTELAECYAQQGRYRRAIARCREVLAADSCREAVYLRLMLYHYYAGEQDRALRAYQSCRRVLADELGVDPLPRTTALYHQIRQRQVGRVDGGVCYPAPAYEERLFEVPYSLGRTPFVGREREYSQLVGRLQQALADNGGVTTIAGEAGLGKTRLAQEALGYVQQRGMLCLSSRCYEVEAAVPYLPIVEALRPLASGDAAFTLPSEWQSELARLFPSLRHRFPDLRLPAKGQQRSLFEAVTQLLATGAAERPVVVFVDDVQWADQGSLSLLSHLIRRATGWAVAWVIAYRPEEVSIDHPLRALLDAVRRDGRLVELGLAPLSLDTVAALIGQMAGGSGLEPALGCRLARESGGNPFYLVSILRNLFEEGALAVTARGDWTLGHDLAVCVSDLMLPPTLLKTLERRLDRLERRDRQVLEVAATLGRCFDFELLQRASNLGEEALLDALDRLAEGRLLEERASIERLEYDLSHEKLREVTYLCIGAARQRLLHRRIAGALLELCGDDPALGAEIAYHFYHGGRPGKAARFSILAGEHALRLYAVQQAAVHFDNATKWAGKAQVSFEGEQLATLHFNWGDALRRSGHYDKALSHYATALPLAHGELKHAILYQICAVGAMRGGSLAEFARLVPSLEKELAGTGDTWALASLRWTQGFMAVLRGDAVRARRCGAVGWHVARRLIGRGDDPSPWLEAQVFLNLGRCYEWWANWRRTIRYASKALAFYTAHDDLNGIAVSHATLGAARYGLGQWERALGHLASCYELATEAGDPRLQGDALYRAGLTHLERGDWHTAERNARRVLAAAQSTGDLLRHGLGQLLLARLHMRQGTPQEAVPELTLILQAARSARALIFAVLVLRFLAEAHFLAGGVAPALSTAREGVELARRSRQKREWGGLLCVLGRALAQDGEFEGAERCLLEAVAVAERIGCRYDLAEAWRGLGVLYCVQGQPDRGSAYLAQALALFDELGAGWDVARTREAIHGKQTVREV